MATRLYIGNLPLSMTQDTLEQLVATKGDVVNIRLVTEPYSRRSRGFAFVEMRRDEEGRKVIQELNGLAIEGRNLVVNEARPKPQDSRRGARSQGRGRW